VASKLICFRSPFHASFVFSFAWFHQTVRGIEAFYQLFVFGQLLPHLSPAGVKLEVSGSQGRADMVLPTLRQIHEFKMLKGPHKYDCCCQRFQCRWFLSAELLASVIFFRFSSFRVRVVSKCFTLCVLLSLPAF
jgi:hypothetical protein